MSELYDLCHKMFSYDDETGLVTRKVPVLRRYGIPCSKPNCKAGDVVGCLTSYGYLVTSIKGKQYRLHRIIWLMKTGSMPKLHIDHVNGIKTDHRWVNLRECTFSENMFNTGKNKNNTIGYKGVTHSKSKRNPYEAKIRNNGIRIGLGLFPTPELAHEAYCKASKELHGVFSNTG